MSHPSGELNELAELAEAKEVQRARILAMTPAERFTLMDQLCREITWIAANAKRV